MQDPHEKIADLEIENADLKYQLSRLQAAVVDAVGPPPEEYAGWWALDMIQNLARSKCSWATGNHDEECDMVAGLQLEINKVTMAGASEISRLRERIATLEKK